MTSPLKPQIEQERILFRYSMALERGDFKAVAAILEAAAEDPSLSRMIQELDAAYITDIDYHPQISGGQTMALPNKRKQAPQSRRTQLLFPFAAIIAIALVGFMLAFKIYSDGSPQNLGGGTETATPTLTETSTPSPLPTQTETPTPSPTPTETSTPSPSPTPTETSTPSPAPTLTETSTPSPSPTQTSTSSPTPLR